jgi:hypothetical protein
MTTDPRFAEMVLGEMAASTPLKYPCVYYDRDGDCIEFLLSGEDFYAERIDTLVTVYYRNGTKEKEIVGSLIKGVRATMKKLLDEYPGLKIDIEDGRVRLSHIFTAAQWKSSDRVIALVYRELRELAETIDSETELCLS